MFMYYLGELHGTELRAFKLNLY